MLTAAMVSVQQSKVDSTSLLGWSIDLQPHMTGCTALINPANAFACRYADIIISYLRDIATQAVARHITLQVG
jgi:hypothetical protein